MNHDQIVDLSLYLAFEAKVNTKEVWRAIEDASLTSLHLFSTKQICQLEWASVQLKPKQTTPRFNTLLIKHALEQVHNCNLDDLINILQGFRQKGNKDMYRQVRQTMINRKRGFFPKGVESVESAN